LKEAETRYKNDRIDYQIVDIEGEPLKELRGKYDIVLATNAVHATTNLANYLTIIRSLLNPSGTVILSEITKPLHWYDLVFGLLDCW
jgi:2-polyprenyl-3-methyl-5-hydroxy-6-metoxy-1,4-benzoquinol methylase